RQKPQRCDAEIVQIIEALSQSREVAYAVAVAVAEGLDVKLINCGVFKPKATVRGARFDINFRPDIHDPAQEMQRNKSAGSSAGLIRSCVPPHSISRRSPVERFSMARTGFPPTLLSPK